MGKNFIGEVVAMGGDASPQCAVVLDVYDCGRVARVVYQRRDGTLLAGVPGDWDAADEEEARLYASAQPFPPEA